MASRTPPTAVTGVTRTLPSRARPAGRDVRRVLPPSFTQGPARRRRRRGPPKNQVDRDTGLRPRQVTSNFFITINPQVVANPESLVATRFLEDVKRIFEDSEKVLDMIEFNKLATGRGLRNSAYVQDVTMPLAVVEQGAKFGRMHAHVLLQIKHKSSIKLNRDEIVAAFEAIDDDPFNSYFRGVEGKSIYVNIRFVPGLGGVLQYMQKDRSVDVDPDNLAEALADLTISTATVEAGEGTIR